MILPKKSEQAALNQFQRLAAEGKIRRNVARRVALELLDQDNFIRDARLLSLVFGMACLLAGLGLFFGQSWQYLAGWQQMILVQLCLVATVAVALVKGFGSLLGQVSLSAGAILIGICLAAYGAIYEIPGNTLRFLVFWAVLILPWAIVAGVPFLWGWMLILLNGILLEGWSGISFFSVSLDGFALTCALVGLNALALLIWECFARLDGKTFSLTLRRVTLLAVIFAIGAAGSANAFSWNNRTALDLMHFLVFIAFIAIYFVVIHLRYREITFLAFGYLAVVWVFILWGVRFIKRSGIFSDASGFFVTGGYIVVLAFIAIKLFQTHSIALRERNGGSE